MQLSLAPILNAPVSANTNAYTSSFSQQVDAQLNDGASPLFVASQNGHLDIAKFLLLRGAHVNLQKHDGATSLHIAAEKGHKVRDLGFADWGLPGDPSLLGSRV